MKTPTPTEVKMSALDKRDFTPRPKKQGSLPDNSSFKPSRLTRRRKQGWKRQEGQTNWHLVEWILLVAILAVLLMGLPK